MSDRPEGKIEVLIDAERVKERVKELGAEITEVYDGKTILLIGLLKGCIPFIADLMRAIDSERVNIIPHYMAVSSYKGKSSTGKVRIDYDLMEDIEGRDCLLVEDIVDTGLTLFHIMKMLRARKPASLRVVVLLDKPSRRVIGVGDDDEEKLVIDWIGFEIPDEFVIGYGMDLDQMFRNLGIIGVFHPDETT